MKQFRINQVYNDGVLDVVEKIPKLDEFNTPLSEYDNVCVRKFWFRNISVGAVEIMQAQQVDTSITKKVAIRLFETIGDGVSSKYIIRIGDVYYPILRVSHNYKSKETELTLTEYDYD